MDLCVDREPLSRVGKFVCLTPQTDRRWPAEVYRCNSHYMARIESSEATTASSHRPELDLGRTAEDGMLGSPGVEKAPQAYVMQKTPYVLGWHVQRPL